MEFKVRKHSRITAAQAVAIRDWIIAKGSPHFEGTSSKDRAKMVKEALGIEATFGNIEGVERAFGLRVGRHVRPKAKLKVQPMTPAQQTKFLANALHTMVSRWTRLGDALTEEQKLTLEALAK